jgi:hypothetical protein
VKRKRTEPVSVEPFVGQITALGIKFFVKGEEIVLEGPESAITLEMRDFAREHFNELKFWFEQAERGMAAAEVADARLKAENSEPPLRNIPGGGHPDEWGIDLDAVRITYGSFDGKSLADLPTGYLYWSVTNRVDTFISSSGRRWPFWKLAKAELYRRGEWDWTIRVRSGLVDQLSLRCLDSWKKTAKAEEGFVSWVRRLAWEAWQEREFHEAEEGTYKIEYQGIEWAIEDGAIPVVRSATPV